MGLNTEAEVDVILDANGAPVMKAINNALERMNAIQAVTKKILENAEKASVAFNNGTANQLKSFEKMLQRVEGIEKAMLRLARQPISQANNDRLFAGQIANVAKFNIGLKDAKTAADAFQGRLNDMDRRLVAMGNSGNISGGLLSRRLGLEQAQKDFQGLQREIDRIDRAARRSGISADKTGYLSAEQALFGALRQQKVNLGPYLSQLNKAADEYIAAVKVEQARIRKETAAPPTGGGGGKGPPGLFGATGLTGIFTRTAAYGGAAALIYGAIGAMKEGIDEAVKFDDTLHKIAGVAGLTNTQMGELGHTIMDVSNNTKFARQEIAEATTVLAQAGFSAQDIAASLSAIAKLAAASGSTFAEVTDVMTSAIGSFQLSADEATNVANQLTAALNMTKLNIQQVALGIQYAGATAYENNLSIQDLTASFAALAQAGIRSGSTMGTGIRQLLTDLLTPSKKMVEELKKLGLTMDDINVKTNGLQGVIKTLSDAGFGAAEAYNALEVRAAAAYLALRNHQDIALKVAIAQGNMSAASDANAKSMNSLASQWQQLKNHINNGVTEAIEPATEAIKNWFKAINDGIASQNEEDMMRDRFLQQFKDEADASAKAEAALQSYREEKDRLAEAEQRHADNVERTQTAVNKASEALDHEQQVGAELDRALIRLAVHKEQLSKDSVALATETLNLENSFAGLAAMLQGLALNYDNVVAAVERLRLAQLQLQGIKASQAFQAADAQVRAYQQDGSYALHAINQSGIRGRLPKDVQRAIDIAQHPRTATDRAQANIVISNFLGSSAGHNLSPNDQKILGQYGGIVGQLGTANMTRDQAGLSLGVVSRLMSSEGQKIRSNIQGIRTESQGRAVMADIQRRIRNTKDPAALGALGTLLNDASQQTSLVTPPRPPASKAKKPSRAAEHAQERRDLDIAKEKLRADEMDLRGSIKDVTKFHSSLTPEDGDIPVVGKATLTSARINKNIGEVNTKLENWVAARLQLMNAQIARDDMGGADASQFKAAVMHEIQEKREETGRAVAEELSKALDVMVKATEDIAAEAAQKADHELAMAQGRLRSLDRSAARGEYVPGYVRSHYERNAARAQDRRDQTQIGINENEIQGLNNDLKVFTDAQAKWSVDYPHLAAQMSPYYDKVRDLRREITGLTNQNAELRASFENMIPPSFGQEMNMMIEDWKKAHGMTMTLNQDLAQFGSQGLDAAYQAMTGFFTDILTGTKSVKEAFGDMVKSIIKALEELVAQFIAKQIFKLILSAFGGGMWNGGDVPGQWNGGSVKGAWGGEHIKGPIEGRDSVLRKLAPGEFVMRRAAVRSVGVANMRRINEMGANALRPMQGSGQQQGAPVNQQVAVYVVKENERPQMGPRDVLVAVHEDILKNGETKKLIKLVSQGA